MIPATEEDLENIMLDFDRFLKLGNGEMKAAYLAASGRGFIELVKSNKNDLLLMRETDNKFIVFSYLPQMQQVPEVVEKKNVVKFHVDKSILNPIIGKE